MALAVTENNFEIHQRIVMTKGTSPRGTSDLSVESPWNALRYIPTIVTVNIWQDNIRLRSHRNKAPMLRCASIRRPDSDLDI
jgi:hypothetical protein